MTYGTVYQAKLRRHPATPAHLVRSVAVQVSWEKSGALALTFALEGNLQRLCIPALQLPCRADGLWQHTCFEAFIRHPGKPAYCEFNFAPSGQWAAYAFRRYRDGMSLAPEVHPHIAVRSTEDRLELDALIEPQWLPRGRPQARLQLALAAVVEDGQGGLSYWALIHPPGRPDFHHPAAFALELARPGVHRGNIPPEEENR